MRECHAKGLSRGGGDRPDEGYRKRPASFEITVAFCPSHAEAVEAGNWPELVLGCRVASVLDNARA